MLYKQQIPRSRVEVLESRVKVLQNRVEVLQSLVEVLQSLVEVLQSLVEVLQSLVEVLESRVEVPRSHVEVLQSRVEVLKSRVGVLQTLSHRDQVHSCVGVARLLYKTLCERHRFHKSPQTKRSLDNQDSRYGRSHSVVGFHAPTLPTGDRTLASL
ncbi:hypothetical protein [Nostoc sp.]|uniref:hypothetical protein n=1 Tax=Nostoc sp. TaxID=1180 RepID=UPI002FF76A62